MKITSNIYKLAVINIFILLCSLELWASKQIEMAITVDDLPVHGLLPKGLSRQDIAKKMVRVLKKHKIPQVYGFINASKFEIEKNNLEVLSIWRKANYPLANHTYSHIDLGKSAADEFKENIIKNEKSLKELSGETSWKYFRYPYLREGDTLNKRNEIRAFLKQNNYKIAQVTIDFEDWAWNSMYARCKDKKDDKSISELKKYYLKHAEDTLDRAIKVSDFVFDRPIKHILLLHVGAFSADTLDALIKLYKKKGVKFISLDEASRDDIYNIDPEVYGKYGSEFQYQVLKSKKFKTQKREIKDKSIFDPIETPETKLNKYCI